MNRLRLPHVLLLGLCLSAPTACDEDPASGGTAIARIDLAPEGASLEAIGEIVPMQALVYRGNGSLVTDAEVVWSSSDPRVATVDKSGLVRATGDGETGITAAFGGVHATTTLTVLQRVAGFGFGTGPSDAVTGGTSGDVTAEVKDPLGVPVARAGGAVTLRILPGSPGDLVGGPRTVALVQGVAVFTDVRVTGEGEGYRLEATWNGQAAASLAFSVVPGPDIVALSNSAGGEHGFLIDGFASGTFENDHSVVGSGDTVAVGIFRSMPGSNDEVLVFGPARRPAMLRPVPWTAGIDTVAVPLEEPIALDLTVWIVKGPFGSQSARAIASIDTTRNIWLDQYAGLVLDSVEIVDATGDPDAPTFFDVTLC
ncbi:MAG: Ig-like domain-containing protein, partial [Gemmatimonadota bacterium]